MTDYCKGCLGIRITDEDNIRRWVCTYTEHNKDGKCPCTSCIVKVMCDDVCKDWKAFRYGKRSSL